MDVDVAEVNGGNAEVAHDDSNLESTVGADSQIIEPAENENSADESKMEVDEMNGDVKGDSKKIESPVKRKLRKSKSNSTSSVEIDAKPKTRGQKRKLSEADDTSSQDSIEFFGFEESSILISTSDSKILEKLIAEAELEEATPTKRGRSLTKVPGKKSEDISEKLENDAKSIVDEPVESDGVSKSKDDGTNSLVSGKNPSPTPGQKIDMSNPMYKEPFKHGWKREMVYKGINEGNQKRSADIYYYSPKGKKVKSLKELSDCLTTKQLTLENFTFHKEPIGVDDPALEVIRDAKRLRSDSTGAHPTPPKKNPPTKRGSTSKKAASPTPAVKTPTSKWSPPKTTTPASFKVKITGKRGSQKKETKTQKDQEMLPPPWSSPSVTRRSQAAAADKISSPKNKRLMKAKVQEPCSIRCSLSMGLIPSLQCSVCLCLYHPECVGGTEVSGKKEYICKNCQPDEQSHQPSTNITPPPLIPISMIGSHNTKSTFLQTGLTQPIMHRILKPDNNGQLRSKSIKTLNSTNVTPKKDKRKERSWFNRGNDFMQSHDGSMSKPPQNIAVMGGKRYIVVPKDNDMAVQPAITTRSDKVSEKTPIMRENSSNDTSEEDSINSRMSVNENSKENDASVEDIERGEKKEAVVDNSLNDDELIADEAKIDKIIASREKMIVDMIEDSFDMNKVIESDDERFNSSDNEMKIVSEEQEVTPSDMKDSVSSISNKNKTRNSPNDEKKSANGKEVVRKRKQPLPKEVDQSQYFMPSVCAGYHTLSRIFQYLKVQELLRAARVCRMWRDLAAHQALWKTVRMKNSQVTDWDGLAATLRRHETRHLDLRKMLIAGESDNTWKKFVSVIPTITSLLKLELCKCPVMVVEEAMKNCSQLEVLSAISIKCDTLNLESVGNLKNCQELKLKAVSGMSLQGDLTPLQELTQLTLLNLTSVKELGKKKIEVLSSLVNLQTLELGECSDFPDKFGTNVLLKLTKLERLRLEKGQGSCCTFDILDGVSKLETLHQLELVNFDVKNGFDKCLANCKNIKRLLIIPTYISQSATSNNMVLGGITELSDNLTHFVWGVTLELLRVTELFVDQCNQINRAFSGDSIPVLKPVPCAKLIENSNAESKTAEDEKISNSTNPQVDILPLPQLQRLLLMALPKTRVKILRIPFHATWRQSISDTTTQ